MNSVESQSKPQFDTQSLRENKTGYSAESMHIFTGENFKKSPHLFALIFIPS